MGCASHHALRWCFRFQELSFRLKRTVERYSFRVVASESRGSQIYRESFMPLCCSALGKSRTRFGWR
jgi:hypothetical protein